MDTADNNGDILFYEILSIDHINKITKNCNPVTLTMSVVRIHVVYSSDATRCVGSKVGFKFYNISGDELFGTEETTQSPYNISNPSYTSSQYEPWMPPSIEPRL